MPKYVVQMGKEGSSETYQILDKTARQAVADEATARQQAIGAGDAAVLAQIAPVFAAGTAYTAGQYVTYEGVVYCLTEDHAAGTTWANTKKAATNMGQEINTKANQFGATEAISLLSLQGVVNGYINASGAITTHANWRTAYKIPTKGATTIRLSGMWYPSSAGGNNNVWCYDANGESIGGCYNTPINGSIDVVVTLLEGTEYVSVTNHATYIDSSLAVFGSLFDYLANNVPEGYEEIRDAFNLFNLNDYAVAGYIGVNGTIRSNNAWRMIYKLPVDEHNKIHLEGEFYKSTGGGMSNVWCYDSKGNSLGSAYSSPGTDTKISVDVSLLVGTAYVSIANSVAKIEAGATAQMLTMPPNGATVPMNNAEITMVPVFGQSLSVGYDSEPAISTSAKYKAEVMFNVGVLAENKAVSAFTSFIPLAESVVETPSSGCADKILEQIQMDEGISVNADYWNTHKILMVSCGKGSRTIAELMSDYYTGLQNAVQGAKNICDAKGQRLNVPCFIFIQGESDQKRGTSYQDYKTALEQMQASFDAYVKSVTGQTNDVKCVLYQTCGQNIAGTVKHPAFNNTALMDVPMAQMHTVRDNALFIPAAPVYCVDHIARSYHLTPVGSKMIGIYCGIGAKAAAFGHDSATGLVPISYTVSGNDILIQYKVPVPPMRIDTEWVKEVSGKGFVVLDANDTNIVSDVSVFDDTVTVSCNASPVGCVLFYGFNGTEGQDGRVNGSRGNICDSAKYTVKGEITGRVYPLANYSYAFVIAGISGEGGQI